MKPKPQRSNRASIPTVFRKPPARSMLLRLCEAINNEPVPPSPTLGACFESATHVVREQAEKHIREFQQKEGSDAAAELKAALEPAIAVNTERLTYMLAILACQQTLHDLGPYRHQELACMIVVYYYYNSRPGRLSRRCVDMQACHDVADRLGPGIEASDVRRLMKVFLEAAGSIAIEEHRSDRKANYCTDLAAALHDVRLLVSQHDLRELA